MAIKFNHIQVMTYTYMRLGLVLHEDIYILIVLSTCSKGFNEEYLAAYSMMENFMRGYNHNSIEV